MRNLPWKMVKIILIIFFFSLTCNEAAENNCLSCNTSNHRTIKNSDHTCPCDANYYDSNVALCDNCHYTW